MTPGQLLDEKVFDTLRPIIDDLLTDKSSDLKNKQRGAAELIAGIMGGKAATPEWSCSD
jgi:hypothetical protein